MRRMSEKELNGILAKHQISLQGVCHWFHDFLGGVYIRPEHVRATFQSNKLGVLSETKSALFRLYDYHMSKIEQGAYREKVKAKR